MPGPAIRTDIVEVYVFRRPPAAASGGHRGSSGVEFLQLHRCKGRITNTWQPVMGHIEEGETATKAALSEMAEETGLRPIALWQLESVNTYFLAALDAVMHSPGFAAEVAPASEPRLDAAHDAHRWVTRDQADRVFLWPGQRRAIVEIIEEILPTDSVTAPLLRLPI